MKLTEEQLQIVKGLIEASENFADQILHVMKNHKLEDIDGCELTINVTPQMIFSTEWVQFGNVGSDSGIIRLAKGRRYTNEKFVPFGKNSPEYEILFGNEAVADRFKTGKKVEKPLPPDGLWIGDERYDAPLDCDGHEMKEWDPNDSLS